MKFRSINVIVTAILVICVIAGCRKSSDPSALKRYDFKGRVVEISNPEKKVLKISHEEVKGFMSAMTMNFPVRDDITGVSAGDDITATLVFSAADNRSWLEGVKVIKKVLVVPTEKPSATPAPQN